MKLTKLFGLAFGLTASVVVLGSCDNEIKKEAETTKINALNASKEEVEITVPLNPERIAILDMASLDIIDALGEGNRVVGSADVTIDYLEEDYSYEKNENIMNIGNVKTPDMEKLVECDPDIIFIGGRLSSAYDKLNEIAPVVYLAATAGDIYNSTIKNVVEIAKIFDKSSETEELINEYSFESRINAIKTQFEGSRTLITMVNGNSASILSNSGRCSLIGNELGFLNIGDSAVNSTHGDEASFEVFVKDNPDYIFVMNRNEIAGDGNESSADNIIGGNNLVQLTNAYKNNNIVYLAHSNVWYLADGGLQALNTYLNDIEEGLGL